MIKYEIVQAGKKYALKRTHLWLGMKFIAFLNFEPALRGSVYWVDKTDPFFTGDGIWRDNREEVVQRIAMFLAGNPNAKT